MTLHDIKNGVKAFGTILVKNSNYILTGFGCGGVLATAILTGKAALNAERYLRQDDIDPDDLSAKEFVKETWRFFVPPVVMGAVSIGCIIGSNAISTSRNASLAALYSLSETALQKYTAKVEEEIGHSKATKIRNDIIQDRVNSNPPQDSNTIIITGNGEVLCYDVLCDRYFKSSPEKIRQQVLDLSYDLRSEMWLDLNDLYFAVGLPYTGLGEKVGFDVDKGQIDVQYSSCLTPDGVPCLSFEPTVYPNPKFM